MSMSTTSQSFKRYNEGDLVQVLDEDSNHLGLAVYVGVSIPEEEGVTYEELQDHQLGILVNDKIFYAIPTAWHYRLLMNNRLILLNTSLFTLLPIGEDDDVSPV